MSVSYEDALTELSSRLGPDSVSHSVRVAETAATLAVMYGADEQTARLAGLLHDWDREIAHAELLESARAREIPVSDEDVSHPYLLHARTGAESLSRTFPDLPSEVLSAVERHTVGAAQMNDIDKIVYVADMIEPYRDFDGVDDLREVVGTVDLDELFARGYQQSVTYLVSQRKQIHPDTVVVWNAHVARGRG